VKVKAETKAALKRVAIRCLVSILAGGVLAGLCEFAPETFRAGCHLAVQILRVIAGGLP